MKKFQLLFFILLLSSIFAKLTLGSSLLIHNNPLRHILRNSSKNFIKYLKKSPSTINEHLFGIYPVHFAYLLSNDDLLSYLINSWPEESNRSIHINSFLPPSSGAFFLIDKEGRSITKYPFNNTPKKGKEFLLKNYQLIYELIDKKSITQIAIETPLVGICFDRFGTYKNLNQCRKLKEIDFCKQHARIINLLSNS